MSEWRVNEQPSAALAARPQSEAGPSVTFEFTPEDWVAVSVRHYASSGEVRSAERTVLGLFVAIVVLVALLSLINGSSFMALTSLLLGGVAAALVPPLLRAGRKKQFTRFAEAGITNGLFGTHLVELREDGILNVTDGYEWLVRWSAVEKVDEGEGSFLVYNGPNSFMVIPHSAFRDSESLRRFADVFYERSRAAKDALSVPEPNAGEPLDA